jgi:hypothetical protein
MCLKMHIHSRWTHVWRRKKFARLEGSFRSFHNLHHHSSMAERKGTQIMKTHIRLPKASRTADTQSSLTSFVSDHFWPLKWSEFIKFSLTQQSFSVDREKLSLGIISLNRPPKIPWGFDSTASRFSRGNSKNPKTNISFPEIELQNRCGNSSTCSTMSVPLALPLTQLSSARLKNFSWKDSCKREGGKAKGNNFNIGLRVRRAWMITQFSH